MERILEIIEPNSTAGVRPWLVYYRGRVFRNMFTVSLITSTGAAACVGQGEWTVTRTAGYHIVVHGFGKRTELKVEHSARLPGPDKWTLSPAQIRGVWYVDEVEVGPCTLQDWKGLPVLELVSGSLGCSVNVFRSQPSLVSCPLIVEGLENCEMLLKTYNELSRIERRSLPKTPPKHEFAGSLRVMREPAFGSGPALEVVGLITAVTQIVIRPKYLTLQ